MTTRSRHRVDRALAAASAAWFGLALSAGGAHAEPPQDLLAPVTDVADVLTPAQEQDVATALGVLADSTDHQLFVVYVGSFDDWSNADWADTTADTSGLGRDDILLAVAVDDRRYQVSVAPDNALTDSQLADVEQGYVEPALQDDDWAGAAIEAARGYAAVSAGAPSPGAGATAQPQPSRDDLDHAPAVTAPRDTPRPVDAGLVLAVVGALLAVALVVTVAVVVVVRRRARAELAALDRDASLALVAVDEAVTASAQEVGFAEARFGARAVEPFAAALAETRRVLAGAFRTRQLLDDSAPETATQRRDMLRSILSACAHVERVLHAQKAGFERLRDAHANAPRDLAAALARAAELAELVDVAQVTWDSLLVQYDRRAVGDLEDAVGTAKALAATAALAAEEGQRLLDTDRVAAVERAAQARANLLQAGAELGALDQRVRDLQAAPGTVAALRAGLESDLGDAARLGAGHEAVQERAAAAHEALAAASRPEAARDPLATVRALQSQEAALDRVLDPLREAEAARQRALARVPAAVSAAHAQIAAAEAAIGRDGWVVGATARTRLAEAQRLVASGDGVAGSDPVAALRDLVAATERAVQAQAAARADVEAERRRRQAAEVAQVRASAAVQARREQHRGGAFGGGSVPGGDARRAASPARPVSAPRRASSPARSGGRRGGGGRF